MTLNGVMAPTLRYFNEFAKPAFQLITGSSSIELIDQKSAFVTHIAVKLVCVTKFTHSRVKWISLLLTCNLSFKFCFTVVIVTCCFRSVVKHCGLCASLLYLVVRVGCRRKTVHVRYLISWWASSMSLVNKPTFLITCGDMMSWFQSLFGPGHGRHTH